MYFDVFLAGAWSVVDPGPDVPNAVYMDGPGPARVAVYAQRRINPGRIHCLVTAAQLAALKASNVPYIHFSKLPSIEKGAGGGPPHVYGRYCVEPGATVDEVKIYRPGKADPEIVSSLDEVA